MTLFPNLFLAERIGLPPTNQTGGILHESEIVALIGSSQKVLLGAPLRCDGVVAGLKKYGDRLMDGSPG